MRNKVGLRWALLPASLGLLALGSSAYASIIIGPNTPNPHSTRGMSMRITPKTGDSGTEFKAAARGFKPGEYVTVWEFSAGDHSTQLLGVHADPGTTPPETGPGYTPPPTGPGYTPPTSG